ncbi:hypothetical protein B0H13DRAFT_2659143 [Mycena leptocephala]|nr:hypothetical protein B0H13DRAFT_2659143 [Mycena leptocephala]
MVQLSRSGLALPLPANFDFLAYTTRPADIPEFVGMQLLQKNMANITTATASAAGAGTLDVGEPLRALFEYSADEKELLISSKELVNAVSPLPSSLTLYIASEQLKLARVEAADKSKRDKERLDKDAEKAKANQDIRGTLLMSNPRPISSSMSSPIAVPEVYLMSIKNQIYFPLHWWVDKVLRGAMEYQHTVPTTGIYASQTSKPVGAEKIRVVDVAKGVEEIGGDGDGSAAPGLPRAYENDPAAPKDTHATELNLHVLFFANIKEFDDLFHVWYPVERSLRYEIFNSGLFDEMLYGSRVEIAFQTHKHVVKAGLVPAEGPRPLPTLIFGNKRKLSADADSDPTPTKQQRVARLSVSRAQTPASREGPHNASDHPSPSKTFQDGSAHFSKLNGSALRTTSSFRGPQPRILCIKYNIGKQCP